MQYMTMRCNLQRCNVDGTLEMKVEKCLYSNQNGNSCSPCYYLNVRVSEEGVPDDAWKKFNSFVDKNKVKTGGRDEGVLK